LQAPVNNRTCSFSELSADYSEMQADIMIFPGQQASYNSAMLIFPVHSDARNTQAMIATANRHRRDLAT
jgi:hypothetical protein